MTDARPLPDCETLDLSLNEDGVLFHTLNRPKSRNAMNNAMVNELEEVFAGLAGLGVRTVVMRGAEGNFCSGGDIKDMSSALAPAEGEDDPLQSFNRRFGRMITAANNAPQTVIAVVEGAVRGGGFGLVCVSDIALAHGNASFALPETGLGLPPAQIAPFVVQRIGLTQARRFALSGLAIDAEVASELGIVHEVHNGDEELAAALAATLKRVARCAPGANAMTKRLMLDVGIEPLEQLLDAASEMFALSARGPEGTEGMRAFIEKRKPDWNSSGEGA